MSRYIIRLDDASEKMDIEKWKQMESLLDKYNVKPLVGVIPHCEDDAMQVYPFDHTFWERVKQWEEKGWKIAMHGYNHVYCTTSGGINPINKRSEFAGLSLEEQKEKIKKGIKIFQTHGFAPKVFFAPSHTFDDNTVVALKECSDIRIISDTIANKPYFDKGITFVPQQSGKVRKLPFSLVTFCYHPNTMCENDYIELEKFLHKNHNKFINFPMEQVKRERKLKDKILKFLYFARRK